MRCRVNDGKVLPKPGAGAPDAPGKSADVPQTKTERKRRRKTSAIITEDVMGDILERWMRKVGNKKVSQREFWNILPSSLAKINRQVVVSFLQKKGVVVVVKFPRRPQLEITQSGMELLEKHKQLCERREREKEGEILTQKTLEFPRKTLSLLKRIAELQATYIRLSAIRSEKEAIVKRIKEFRDELVVQEALLGKVEAREKEVAAKIERLVFDLSQNKVAELIEIAEKSASQE